MDYRQCPVAGCWHIKRGLKFTMCYSLASHGKDSSVRNSQGKGSYSEAGGLRVPHACRRRRGSLRDAEDSAKCGVHWVCSGEYSGRNSYVWCVVVGHSCVVCSCIQLFIPDLYAQLQYVW